MLNKSCQLLLRRMLFVQDNMLKSNAIRNTSLYMETKQKHIKIRNKSIIKAIHMKINIQRSLIPEEYCNQRSVSVSVNHHYCSTATKICIKFSFNNCKTKQKKESIVKYNKKKISRILEYKIVYVWKSASKPNNQKAMYIYFIVENHASLANFQMMQMPIEFT